MIPLGSAILGGGFMWSLTKFRFCLLSLAVFWIVTILAPATAFAYAMTTDSTTVTRTTNAQNQLLSVGAKALTYDSNGNMITDDKGRTYVYDAWNRLVTVKDDIGNVLISYAYDGLNHRITESPTGQDTKKLYYSAQWQVVEERVNPWQTYQYVWSPVYVNALVLRDSTGWPSRFYALHDANFNVTAIMADIWVDIDWMPGMAPPNIPQGWQVAERFVYDSYGKHLVFMENHFLNEWIEVPNSFYEWNYTFQGMRYDATSDLYFSMTRPYSATLQRWISQDIDYFDGPNLYWALTNNPINYVDPLGLSAQWHHLLPRGIFTPEFLSGRGIKGLDINNKEFGWILDQPGHTGSGGIHPDWNKEWNKWIEDRNRNKKPITGQSIKDQLDKMKSAHKDDFMKGTPADRGYDDWKKLSGSEKDKFLPKNMSEKARRAAMRRAAMALSSAIASTIVASAAQGVHGFSECQACTNWYQQALDANRRALLGDKSGCGALDSSGFKLCREAVSLKVAEMGSGVGASGAMAAMDKLLTKVMDACHSADDITQGIGP